MEHAIVCIENIKIYNERFPQEPKEYLKKIEKEATARWEVLRVEREAGEGNSGEVEDIANGIERLDFDGIGGMMHVFGGLEMDEGKD